MQQSEIRDRLFTWSIIIAIAGQATRIFTLTYYTPPRLRTDTRRALG